MQVRTAAAAWVGTLAAALSCATLAGCTQHRNEEGVRNLLSVATPGALTASGALVGYVDMDTIVDAHPLHTELRSLQDQITALNAEAVQGPRTATASQRAAQMALERELENADQSFQQELLRKRSYYERRETEALSAIQAQTAGAPGGPAGVLSGIQAQYGSQVKAMQEQGRKTLAAYRDALFKEDTDHLRSVQKLIAADLQAKVRARQTQLSSAETAYQIDLAKADQDRRLNLKTMLDNLSLSAAERAKDTAELKNIDTREQYLTNQLKTRDNAELKAYERDEQRRAAARFDAERRATQNQTQAKLAARQQQLQNQIQGQAQSLGGKFQEQVAAVNKSLSVNPQVQRRMQDIHARTQSQYIADAQSALSAYRETRKTLVARYSAIAHMQLQDNQAIAAQIDQLASQRRDLFAKIVSQIELRVKDVARRDGVSVVFTSIAAPGTAIDLTQQVIKAVAMGSPGAPSPASTGG